MSWARLDDACTDHLKIRRAGTAGLALWTASIVWCSRHLTDGFIPADMLHDIWRPVGEAFDADAACARLVAAGLWDEVEGGWQVHDYLDYNPSREEVQAQRAQAADRQRRRRAKSPPDPVTPDVTRDVQRDSRGTYTVSHATPSRPVPTRPDPSPTEKGVARARVANDVPAEPPVHHALTPARLWAMLDDAWHAATGERMPGLFTPTQRMDLGRLVERHGADAVAADLTAFAAYHAGRPHRPAQPWRRYLDEAGAWTTKGERMAALSREREREARPVTGILDADETERMMARKMRGGH
jgi:hypothetical protein